MKARKGGWGGWLSYRRDEGGPSWSCWLELLEALDLPPHAAAAVAGKPISAAQKGTRNGNWIRLSPARCSPPEEPSFCCGSANSERAHLNGRQRGKAKEKVGSTTRLAPNQRFGFSRLNLGCMCALWAPSENAGPHNFSCPTRSHLHSRSHSHTLANAHTCDHARTTTHTLSLLFILTRKPFRKATLFGTKTLICNE